MMLFAKMLRIIMTSLGAYELTVGKARRFRLKGAAVEETQ